MPGRTFDSYEKVSADTYKGGCIFVDQISGFIHVEHQVGCSAVETISAKQHCAQLALKHDVVIAAYLMDSGTLKATSSIQHKWEHHQQIHFCGANAHHKNGIPEHAIQSVSNTACVLVLDAATLWKDDIDASLWPI